MKNTLLKTALVLNILLCSINLHGGGIEKSPEVFFLPNNSKIEFYAKALDFSTSPPPEERKKVLSSAEKKKRMKVKKKNEKRRDKAFSRKVPQKNQQNKMAFLGYYIAMFSSVLLVLAGIILFIVGAILFNPVLWILGLAFIVLAFIVFLIFLENIFYLAGLIIYLSSLGIGIALLIIGLVLGIMSLWVGGIVLASAVLLIMAGHFVVGM